MNVRTPELLTVLQLVWGRIGVRLEPRAGRAVERIPDPRQLWDKNVVYWERAR